MRIWPQALLVALVVIGCSGPDGRLEDSLTAWELPIADHPGLFGRATGVQEDLEGNLWFPSYHSGLTRYQPATGLWRTFTVTDGLASNSADALRVDERGDLWVIDSGAVSRLDAENQRWSTAQWSTAFAFESIEVELAQGGGLWVLAARQLFHFTADRASPAKGVPGMEEPIVMARGSNDTLWLAGFERSRARSLKSQPEPVALFQISGLSEEARLFETLAPVELGEPGALLIEPQGRLWIVGSGGLFAYEKVTDSWTDFSAHVSIGGSEPERSQAGEAVLATQIVRAGDGALWFLLEDRVFRYQESSRPGRAAWRLVFEASPGEHCGFLVPAEGGADVWVTVWDAHLRRFRSRVFGAGSGESAGAWAEALPLLQREGRFWSTDAQGTLARTGSGAEASWPASHALWGNHVSRVSPTADGLHLGLAYRLGGADFVGLKILTSGVLEETPLYWGRLMSRPGARATWHLYTQDLAVRLLRLGQEVTHFEFDNAGDDPGLSLQPGRSPVFFSEDQTGDGWIAVDQKLFRCRLDSESCAWVPGLQPTALAPAVTGDLWLGGEAGELTYLDVESSLPPRVERIPKLDNRIYMGRLESPLAITAIHEAPGELWVAAPGLLLKRDSGSSSWEAYDLGQGDFVASEILESNRVLWLLGSRPNERVDAEEIGGVLRYDPISRSKFFAPGRDLYGALASALDAAPPPADPGVPDFASASGGRLMAVDPEGRLWLADDAGLIGFRWLDGYPTRPVRLPFLDRQPTPGAMERSAGSELVLWRGRPRSMLRTGPDGNVEVVSHPTAWPVTRVEAAPGGAMWFGYGPGGLTLRHADGRLKRFPELGMDQAQGGVLDIAQIPGLETPRAWVATQDGVMLVSEQGVERRLPGDALGIHGPVDHLIAREDGSAWLAFNAVDPLLFLDPAEAEERAVSHLRHLPADAGLQRGPIAGPSIELERGSVLDLAMTPRGNRWADLFRDSQDGGLWVGTSAGLYRLQESEGGSVYLERVTARGTLPALPTRRVTVDAEGTVWLGVDAVGGEAGAPATLLGYRPGTDTTQGFDTGRGLPQAERIDFLDTTRNGDLVVFANNQLVIGRGIFVPGVPFWLLVAVVATSLLLSFVFGFGFSLRAYRREEARRYSPVVDTAAGFFATVGAEVTRRGDRELQLRVAEETITVRCALEELLPVEEVQAAFRARAGDAAELSYLVYPRELDPAAARQLDVYRLREDTVIVPLSEPFLRAKRDEGEEAARAALDGIHRRYLGTQDLYDVRNAIDEPRFFFGRRSLLDDLFNALTRGEHVALIGPRKSGKTSALNLLQQRLTTFPVVKIDLQLYHRDDERWPRDLLAEIVEGYDRWGVANHGDAWRPAPLPADATGSAFRRALLERRQLQPRRLPLVLLIDEIERVFPQRGGEVVEHVERFNAVAGVLRSLGQEGGERLLSIIIADLHPTFCRTNMFAAQGVDTNPFYRFFQERFLPALTSDECGEMLREIGHAMGLELDSDICRAVFADSGGHASLARQLASAACRHRAGSARITPEHYQAGLDWLARESGSVDEFLRENLWHPSSAAEKRLLALARGEKPVAEESLEVPGTAPAIDDVESREPATAGREALIEARRRFLVTSILEQVDDGYRVRGALFRAWLRDYLD